MHIEDENHDVFTTEEEAPEETTLDSQEEEAEEEQGEQEEETPASKETEVDKSEKMIPESRLKAALKAQEDNFNRKLAEALPPTPAPDRDEDPDSYDRHQRLEISRDIMRESHEDFDDAINHFVEMAKINPSLNDIVANHRMPAKMAYDLAKKDLELKEVQDFRNSDEWKAFQEFKKSGGKAETTAEKLTSRPKVPNLNRSATNVKPDARKSSDNDDDLFSGHYSVG